jgi:GTP-binding protein
MRRNAQFLKSAVLPEDYPASDRPEVALVGRSNAGKSSLLNAIVGARAAKVSQSPGKTRLLNFFDFGDHYRFVDMPGYGFASRHGSEVLEWEKMITRYLKERENLVGLVLVMDARREWQGEEQWIRESCQKLDLQLIVVLNKIDKFKKNEIAKTRAKFAKLLPEVSIHMVSAEKNVGVEQLEEEIFERLTKVQEST